MKSLTQNKVNPAATVSAAEEENELIVSGAVPPELARLCKSVPRPALPEITKLPPPRVPDPIIGASRTWLVQSDAELPPEERFLFRVVRRGKLRGATFLNVPKLMAFLRKAEVSYQAEILKAEAVKATLSS
jgi:hypothetical protein